MDYLNILIALAYFSISILLFPLLENAYKDVKVMLILAMAFISSCAIGHGLEGFGHHDTQWHFITAIISWMSAAVLATSQSRLKMLSQSFKLLEITWDESLANKILFQRVDDDLEILRINDIDLNDKKMKIGKMFSEAESSKKIVFPQNKTIIDLYLNVKETEKIEFSYQDNNGVRKWYLVVCVPLSKEMVYITSLNLTELGNKAIELNSDNYTIGVILKSNIEKELSLVYQPIVKLLTGEIVGAEALLRWNSPSLGKVAPDRFIPVAEGNGSIVQLSNWVLRTAFEQLSIWKKYSKSFAVSVNISPIELEEEDFLDRLLKLMLEFNIENNSLGIEITERGIYKNLTKYLNALQSLELMHISIKIDDFGTGISNLSNLLQRTFKEIKLDKAFIPFDHNDLTKISICQAIAALSNSLGFSIVAEGIETKEQWEILLELGYEFGQGYYFAKPMPPEEFTKLLENNFYYSNE